MNTIHTFQALRRGASPLGRHRSLALACVVLLAAPIAPLVSPSGADAASVSPTSTGVLHLIPQTQRRPAPQQRVTGLRTENNDESE